MTRKEAIKVLTHLREIIRTIPKALCKLPNVEEHKREDIIAIDIAIEALQFAERFDLLKEYQSLQEVVHCKDCDREYGSPVCPIQSQGWAINTDTFYCAWGERKGGDTE